METILKIHSLAEEDGVARLLLPGPQVLLYREHRPPGIFLLVGGEVSLEPAEGPPQRIEVARNGPCLLTPIDALDRPSPVAIAIRERAELCFFPRSILLARPSLCALLSELPCARSIPTEDLS